VLCSNLEHIGDFNIIAILCNIASNGSDSESLSVAGLALFKSISTDIGGEVVYDIELNGLRVTVRNLGELSTLVVNELRTCKVDKRSLPEGVRGLGGERFGGGGVHVLSEHLKKIVDKFHFVPFRRDVALLSLIVNFHKFCP
jgi:hypothetical protein